MGYISEKLKRRLRQAKTGWKRQDAALRRLLQQVKKPPADVKTRAQLRDYQPLHAAYLAGQNLVSFLAEELSILPSLQCHISHRPARPKLPATWPIASTPWASAKVGRGSSALQQPGRRLAGGDPVSARPAAAIEAGAGAVDVMLKRKFTPEGLN